MLTHVQGGTGAGRTMHRQVVPKTSWVCPHGHQNAGYASTCLAFGCREKRPREAGR